MIQMWRKRAPCRLGGNINYSTVERYIEFSQESKRRPYGPNDSQQIIY